MSRPRTGSPITAPAITAPAIATPIAPVMAPVIAAGPGPGAGPADGPPRGHGVLRLQAAGGAWHLAADTRRYTAVWRPGLADNHPPAGGERRAVGAASSWELEPLLGFVLPDAAHTTLATTPPWPDRDDPAGGVDPRPGERDTGRPDQRPRPGDLLHLPDGSAITYGQALDASRPARSWHLPAGAARDHRVVVEIVDAVPAGDGRRALIYRVRCGGDVVACADDIEVPADVDPRDDATLRALVGMLTHPDPDTALPGRLREFLTRHGDALLSAVAEPAAPYPPGTRIAVTLPHAGRVTGTVAALTGGRDGQVRCYHWRPDATTRPGHPWHHPHGATATVVSPAAAVTATLHGPNDALTGRDNGGMLLTVGAAAGSPTDDGRRPPTTVASESPGDTGPSYDVRFHLRPPDPAVTRLDGHSPRTRQPADQPPLDARPPERPVPVTADEGPAGGADVAVPPAVPDATLTPRLLDRAAVTGLADVLELAARAVGAGGPTGTP
jgi:hypothetical protein